MDPPLKVLSFYKNEQEDKDLGDDLYDMINSDLEDDKRIISADKGMLISVDSETDMLYMRPFRVEVQEAIFLLERIKFNLMINME